METSEINLKSSIFSNLFTKKLEQSSPELKKSNKDKKDQTDNSEIENGNQEKEKDNPEIETDKEIGINPEIWPKKWT